jgi:ketosteroid isomerase-like protein
METTTLDKTEANVGLVQSLYAAFGRGDLDTLYAAAAPDIDWEAIGPPEDYPLFGKRRGVAGMKEFFATLTQHEDISEFTPRDIRGAGDKVFALGHYTITIKKTGRRIACDWCHVFTLRDGKVTAWREHTDSAAFVKASNA